MGYVLLIVGLLMIVTGVRDTYRQFGQLLVSDFTGPGNFTYWVVAIGAVGAMGYVKPLQTFSRAFLFLMIIGMVLSNRGFFAKFTEALQQGPAPSGAPAARIMVTPQKKASNDNTLDDVKDITGNVATITGNLAATFGRLMAFA